MDDKHNQNDAKPTPEAPEATEDITQDQSQNQEPEQQLSQAPAETPTEPQTRIEQIQQPVSVSRPSAPPADKQEVINYLLVFAILAFYSIVTILMLVIGDIIAALLHPGEGNVGLGTVFGLYLSGPPLIVFGVLTLLGIGRAKRKGQAVGRTLKLALLISIALLIVSSVTSLFTFFE